VRYEEDEGEGEGAPRRRVSPPFGLWQQQGSEDRLFLLVSGHICLGRPQVRAGDVVVVLPGVSMPFVLRKRPCSERCEMIGPTYVHGFKDGEEMEDLAKGRYEVRSFTVD
jgi:hypothetical protein